MIYRQKKSRPIKRAATSTYQYFTARDVKRQVRRNIIGFFTFLLLGFGCGIVASTQAALFSGKLLFLPLVVALVVMGWIANNMAREMMAIIHEAERREIYG